MRLVRPLIVLMAFVVVAAACGGEVDETTTTAPPPTTAATTTVAPTTTTLAPPTTIQLPISLGADVVPLGADLAANDRCTFPNAADSDKCAEVAKEVDNAPVVETEKCLTVKNEVITSASAPLVQAILDGDQERFNGATVTPGTPALDGLDGLNLLELAGGAADDWAPDVADALRDLGIPAARHYIVIPTPKWKWGPGGGAAPAPNPTNPPLISQAVPSAESESVVTVIDTGYPDSATTFSNLQQSGASPEEPSGLDGRFVGHGLFIAGVIRQLAPDIEIYMRSPYVLGLNADDHAGALIETAADLTKIPWASESEIWLEMELASAGELADGGVINISGGTYPCKPDDVPLVLAGAVTAMATAGIQLVASAGNDSVHIGNPADGPPSSIAPDDVVDVMLPAGYAFDGILDPSLAQAASTFTVEAACDDTVRTFVSDDTQVPEDTLDQAIGEVCAAIDVILGGAWQPGNVMSVGAVDRDNVVATFSNWAATHWAVGVNVISVYPDGVSWTPTSGDVQSTGAAQWDGTSFAAPVIAALLASGKLP